MDHQASIPDPAIAMFEEAQSALHAGDRSRARDLLTRLLKITTNNPEYWVWMSAVVDTPREQQYCLKEALRLAPDHIAARWGATLAGLIEPDPSLGLPYEQQKRTWSVKEGAADLSGEKSHPQKRIWLGIAMFGGAVVILIALLIIGIFGWGGQKRVIDIPSRLQIPGFATSTLMPAALTAQAAAYTTPTNTAQAGTTLPQRTSTGSTSTPAPLSALLKATYTPTSLYVNTPHPRTEAYNIGLRALQRGDLSSAFNYLGQVITIEPTSADALYYLAEAYRLQAASASPGNAVDQALRYYNQAITVNSKFAPAYLGRARLNLAKDTKPYDSIIKDLESAIDRDPKMVEAFIELASVKISRKDAKGALPLLESAQKLAPDSPQVYLYRGQANMALGKPAQALDDARLANQKDITQLEAYRLLGQALQANGDIEESIEPLKTYLAYEPNDFEVLVWLANADASQEDYAGSLALLDRAIQLNHNSFEAYLLRAQISLARKDGQPALNDYLVAVKLKNDSFAANIGLGQAYLMLDYPGDAYLQFERSQASAKTDAEKGEVYYWRAQSLEKINQNETALRDWRSLVALPDSAVPQARLDLARERIQALVTPTPTLARPTASLAPTLTATGTPTPTVTGNRHTDLNQTANRYPMMKVPPETHSSGHEMTRHGMTRHGMTQHGMTASRRISLLLNRRARRKQRLQRAALPRVTRWGIAALAVSLLLIMTGLIGAAFFYSSLTRDLPSLDTLSVYLDPSNGLYLQPTRFYDRTGQKILYSLENPGIARRYLSIDPQKGEHISPELSQAIVAVIDPTFWQNTGADWNHYNNPQPSTLAEKLVDNLFLSGEPRDLRRSLRMRLLASQLISTYGHSQVLEWYINSAYYGHLAYGADSASRLYLAKPASQLNYAEAAYIAAAALAPALNPLDAPAAAREEQIQALNQMLVQRSLTLDAYQQARFAAVNFAAAPAKTNAEPGNQALAYFRLVSAQLTQSLGQDRVERGGLRIITALDIDLQQQLVCLTRTQLTRLQGSTGEINLPGGKACQSALLLPGLPPGEQTLPAGLSATAMLLDVPTGRVVAMIGDTTSQGEKDGLGAYDPGSLLTPFVSLAGFARGYGPASPVWDIPASLPADLADKTNPDGKFHGPVRLRTALANDYLAPLAQMTNQVGPANVFQLAETMGMRGLSDQANDASFLYQGASLPLAEIAQAYQVFANRGTAAGARTAQNDPLQPTGILKVEDVQGHPLLDFTQPDSQALLSPQLAYLVNNILSDETARWPSIGYPNPLEIDRPVGAKIGRVEDGRSIWVVGYTPQYLAIFRLALPENSAPATLNPRAAAGMWRALVQYTHRSLPVVGWDAPPGVSNVEVCDPSGLLPTSACPSTVNEVFLNGSEPTGPDTFFHIYQVNRESGKLATVFTPQALVEGRTYMNIPAEARGWARSAGIPLPPETYDALQVPASNPLVHITNPSLFAYLRGLVPVTGAAAGSDLTSYRLQAGEGLNPQTWTQIGNEGKSPVIEGELGVWDTRGKDGLFALRLTVVRQNQMIDTAVIQVTVDNTPPRVRVQNPLPAQRIQLASGQIVTFRAEVTDSVGVGRVEYILDGKLLGERLQAPFSYPWEAVLGSHNLEVRAYDLAGNEGDSDKVTFTVEP